MGKIKINVTNGSHWKSSNFQQYCSTLFDGLFSSITENNASLWIVREVYRFMSAKIHLETVFLLSVESTEFQTNTDETTVVGIVWDFYYLEGMLVLVNF